MKTTSLKIVLNIIGSVCVVLAIFGIFLPLLPTTPFLLLASACFARGSERLHGWLLRNKTFGPLIADFEQGRGIPRRAKATALIMLWLSLAWSASRMVNPILIGVLAVVGVGVTTYLLFFVPTRPAVTPDA